jgi:hypothetical protein
LRDLTQQKIPRELCDGADPAIFLGSHIPMERFFDARDQINSKNTRRKGTDQEIKKNKKERMGERKRRDCYVFGGSCTHVFSLWRKHTRGLV